MTDVYDSIYAKCANYNLPPPEPHYQACLCFSKQVGGAILDAGCGRGNYLRRLIRDGVPAYGIEPSKVCCEMYLGDVPYSRSDIISFKPERKFNGLICMDVLEHLEPASLDANLQAISRLAPNALLGIANFDDVMDGRHLHLILEDSGWWRKRLEKFFASVWGITDSPRHFIFQVSPEGFQSWPPQA
jgi:SAM-dependent methyltransferase